MASQTVAGAPVHTVRRPNAWIHHLKHAASPIRLRLAQLTPADVVTCSIVRAELLHGAEKYGRADRPRAVVAQTLEPFASLPFDDAAAEPYAAIRHELESTGDVIGPFDLLIAAICVANNCTLVTSNVDEFSRIQQLTKENRLEE